VHENKINISPLFITYLMYIIIIKAYIEYIYKKDIKVTRVHS